MEDIIEIPKKTTIEYLITEIEKQLPNSIPDFLQLYKYIRKMLSAPTKTIETNKLGKSRPITTYSA
ncbi:hypothetical protein G9A89_001186 [Geosiphon pyriformis]|nr:hypothetical protein G9A89_001186 [Geosiphon pyriformis]